ncbi:hypothetical protein [Streptomyces sp. NPDC058657]|uniref:hypothetical protein n=1 Tax=unclassified Streptomyces TaxID=2593676 RepID=UPI00365724F8
MRGDEAQVNVAGGEAVRARSGPRHAAPRKSLLTKLHMPAGKALALAAMPTAVFVGMSLTPKLAMAADEPANPFAPGPCVTQPDAADEDADGKPGKDAEGKDAAGKDKAAAEKDKAGEGAGDGAADGAKPGTTPAPGATRAPGKGGTQAPGKGGTQDPADDAADPPAKKPADGAAPAPATTEPEPEPENPLDPLGVGDKIKDFFDGLGGKKQETPAAPSAPATSAPAPKPTPKAEAPAAPGSGAAAPKGTGGAKAPTAGVGGAAKDGGAEDAREQKAEGAKKAEEARKAEEAKDALDKAAKDAKAKADAAAEKTEKVIRDAAEKLGIEVADLDQDGDGKPDLVPNADGTLPFPCPAADPQALADAKLEPGIPALPDDPWTLETSMLTLRGLNYEGIVEVRTAGGKIKKVLKFTAKETDIKDLHQMTVGPGGTTGHVQASKGSTSTLRRGTVTMYTEELKGNLFGLIPVTFSPQTPPPLNVPIAMFTKAKVTQAGQFGGTLTVPGLHNYFTGPGTGQAAAD